MSVADETREESVEPRNEGPCGCSDQVRLERAIHAVLDILAGQKLHPETPVERILREALRGAK